MAQTIDMQILTWYRPQTGRHTLGTDHRQAGIHLAHRDRHRLGTDYRHADTFGTDYRRASTLLTHRYRLGTDHRQAGTHLAQTTGRQAHTWHRP